MYEYADSTLENAWILLILTITCPYNPNPFDANKLASIRIFAMNHIPKAAQALDTQWAEEADTQFTATKINILVLFGKYSHALSLAKYTL